MTVDPAHHAPPGRVTVETLAPRGALVRVAGELDIALAPELARAIAGVIADGHRHVGLDLAQVTFMDCASLRTVFASLAPLSGDPGACVAVGGASGVVERMLRLLAVDEMLGWADDARGASELVLSDGRHPDGWRHHARVAAAEDSGVSSAA